MTKLHAISSTTSRSPLACTPRRACPPRIANPNTAFFAEAKIGWGALTIELDPKHVDVAVSHWQKWFGKEARGADPGLTFVKQAARRAGNSNQRPTLSPNQGLSQTPEQHRKRMHAA
jgi:hypothetical protein